MEKIIITTDDLMDILREYDSDRWEAEPMNGKSFCNYIFEKYHRERSKREDSNISNYNFITGNADY